MASVFDPVCCHAAATPDNIALRGGADQWTYRQLRDASVRYAGALAAAGLSPGDRVLLAAPSVPEFVVAYLGIQAAGCVVVPVNTMSTRAEVEYVLGDAGCSLAIAWHALGPAVAEAASALKVPSWALSPGATVTDAGPARVVDRDRDETAANTAFGTFNDIDRGGKTGYTGRAVPRLRIQVRDIDGNECPPGTVGEVHIKGPTVMRGYWKRPADTAAAISPDGWFRTGDLGETDTDGDLRIVDRIKDLIIRGGYNVYPGEVEEVLYEHPDIIEAAVIGVPDDHYGEEVAALVAARPGSDLGAAEVSSWTRERLSAYKVPRIIRFVDALPKGPSGKILKRSIDRTELTRDPALGDVPARQY
jgi:acyl-CoA synthetase (AMP-forming)/AMP-acid ligase II